MRGGCGRGAAEGSSSGFCGEGDCSCFYYPLLKGQFSEAEPSDQIPRLWIWAVPRSFVLRLLIPFCMESSCAKNSKQLSSSQTLVRLREGKDLINSSDLCTSSGEQRKMQWDLQVFVAPCCLCSTWGFHASLLVGMEWAAGRSCPRALRQEEGNSELCHSEADLGGLHETPAAGPCTNMQNLATELGSFWGKLCEALVPSVLGRSEDQLTFLMEVLIASWASSEILGLSV